MEETSCRGCLHWRRMGLNSRERVCHYLEDTGRLRGCPTDRCDKKEPAPPEQDAAPRSPWLLSSREETLCLACGEPIDGPRLEVTDLADLPWRFAFLHRNEDCRRTFYQEYRQACLDFFCLEVEQRIVELLAGLETPL